jgi:hypothetical protein
MTATNTETGEALKEPAPAQLLFAQVLFYIVPSPGLRGETMDSVRGSDDFVKFNPNYRLRSS